MINLSQAAELRKPFPKSAIGKLPKPYSAQSTKGNCKDCGGYHGLPAAHLDYVGHAAVTDRLLGLDPNWTWEPFALDANGLPAMTSTGNLWIRLTVCGTVRIGVGDGKSLKECIGDAIRNAAMRFGVALDLWSKEELEQSHGPAERARPPAPLPKPEAATEPVSDASGPRSAAQSTALHTAFGALKMTDRDVCLSYCVQIIERQIDSTKDLTKDEASKILDALHEDERQDSLDVDIAHGQQDGVES